MTGPCWLDPGNDLQPFPSPEQALDEPNGLLAAGGCLSPRRLMRAYRRGIFPWYGEGQPILWWSPDPRTVLFPDRVHVSRSLRKRLRQGRFELTMDQAFEQVIAGCAEPRADQEGTWITREMRAAYILLHHLGHAHSVEVWHEGRLAGGLYGIAVGRAFFGESMFSRQSDASKAALVGLCVRLTRWEFGLIDCQMQTGHLTRMGAVDLPRRQFLDLLDRHCSRPAPMNGAWHFTGLEAVA